ncbi:hypothetical protein GCM10010255_82560 [Streptomyces coeruleofuscus]|uniref:Uncharacterized protein n=1 Tax=Streptomyces coeruleofuscus TaxID=66879 RepID=A0ABN3JG47_9ACTN
MSCLAKFFPPTPTKGFISPLVCAFFPLEQDFLVPDGGCTAPASDRNGATRCRRRPAWPTGVTHRIRSDTFAPRRCAVYEFAFEFAGNFLSGLALAASLVLARKVRARYARRRRPDDNPAP